MIIDFSRVDPICLLWLWLNLEWANKIREQTFFLVNGYEKTFHRHRAQQCITWYTAVSIEKSINNDFSMRTVPGNQGFIILATFSSNKKHNREKILYHPLMSIYTLRHHTTGQLPRVQPHDIVIFAVVPFFGLGAGHRLLPSVFEGWHRGGGGFLIPVTRGQVLLGLSVISARCAASGQLVLDT